MQLRPYQKSFIQDIWKAYAQGHKAPLGQLPTGGGKTACMAHMSDGAARKGRRICVLAHRQELIIQTSIALARQGVYHSIVAPDAVIREAVKAHVRDPDIARSFFAADAPTMVASVQTLARRLHVIAPADFLMIDEAHHAVAGSWQKVLAKWEKAKILGVTATPERLDGKGLGLLSGGCFTTLIEGPSVTELTEMGFLAPARIYAPPSQFSLDGIRTKAGDFDRKQSAERIDKPTITGDAIDHYRRLCKGMPAIAFCASVDHARHVAEQFNLAGYRSTCVDGGMHDAERRRAITGLGNGSINVLTSCDIISEGTDVPIVGAAILLRPTKSLGLYLQQVGRVLRPYPGKEHAIILDHVGNVLQHGLPEEDREWSLTGRRKRATSASDAMPTRQCNECFAVFPAGNIRCPACGAFYEASGGGGGRVIEEKEGSLVEVDKAQLRRERAREQSSAETLADLTALGRSRGYKNPEGWANHIIKARSKKRERVGA